jgi:hypothetical protein
MNKETLKIVATVIGITVFSVGAMFVILYVSVYIFCTL